MSAPLVLFTDQTDIDLTPARTLLAKQGLMSRIAGPEGPVEAARAIAAEGLSVQGLVVGFADVDAVLLDALPGLTIIATTSAGLDMVDSAAARSRGIPVVPLVDASTDEVAAHSLSLMLAVERQLLPATQVVAEGGWTADITGGAERVPRRFSELTVGLLGCGRIAQRLAQLLRPLVGAVIAHDPHRGCPEIEQVSLDQLLCRSDVLSLHAPLTPQTHHLLDAGRLAQLPPGATVVNCSRGELVDPDALRAALDSGHLRGAGLDVLPGEPPSPASPLRTHPQVVCTPHTAFWSDRALEAYAVQPARTVLEHLTSGRLPAHAVL
ncbi:C-terminal binding protein [Nesterenkonia suensis]